MYILLFGVIGYFVIIIFGGIYAVIKGAASTIKPKNNIIDDVITVETPYYINDEINAIYDQISIYNRLIDHYKTDLEYTYNIEKRLKLEKTIADLEYKTAKLENKVNKLLEKWD